MTRTLLLAAAFAATVAVLGTAHAAPAPFTPIAGQHYREVVPPVPTDAKPGQVEVIEFFSLGCPHCAEFEPYLQSWLKRKPANVKFRRVPAVFNPFFRMMARVTFALDDVGAADRLMPQLFDAIHERPDPDLVRPLGDWQNKSQRGEEAAAAEAEKQAYEAFAVWVGKRGVDAKKFRLAFNSPSMMTRLAQADTTFKRFGALGVPAVGVNGKHFTTAGRPLAVRTYAELMATVDHLVALESKAAR
jgi:thiol:disulfide interchange protein DsbA